MNIDVALSLELNALVEGAVASGKYSNASEVISEALREWQTRRTQEDSDYTNLQKLWNEGIASGPGSLQGMDAIKAKARRRLNSDRSERG